MENIFWWTSSEFEEIEKVVIGESIKDLENAINEIEDEAEEVKILIIKKNGDEKYINFKHNGYMKDVIKDRIVQCFEGIKIIHETILEEI
ncbi:TPA: hypothetical protein JD074_08480 [Clostridioides difficile]|jgi:hypothetical protein|uniref:hypothetical protein n=1 Tax=Clostridioides difficile TaxID=1496 RepID=UPI0009787ECC|nr:hypothetical protein [Clostridioides difficile]EIS9623099.1 hypothetical protein [Clostridioides difficile]MCP3279316.1 hypothetical protein [Clostridioides difficile]MDN4814081.1 hypothetical protein [Clostridioides difficile]MDO0037785.1 hypothetical protein [Clostridioides difficile]MDX5681772.1 hypothetical protein [Clostridioides difficile]